MDGDAQEGNEVLADSVEDRRGRERSRKIFVPELILRGHLDAAAGEEGSGSVGGRDGEFAALVCDEPYPAGRAHAECGSCKGGFERFGTAEGVDEPGG